MDTVSAMSITVPLTLIGVTSIITTLSQIMSVGDEIKESGMGSLTASADSVLKMDVSQFDGKDKKGVEVASFIANKKSELAILVWNLGCNEGEYFNYGVLLDGAPEPAYDSTYSANAANKISKINKSTLQDERASTGYYQCEVEKDTDGTVKRNTDTSGITKKACYQYIANAATYSCLLVKDRRGNTVAVMCTQID